MKSSWNFEKVGLGNVMNTCSRHSGCTGQHPTHGCQARPNPFCLLSGRDCRTQVDATSPSLDDEGMDGLHNLIADESGNLRQVQGLCKDLQHRHEQRRLRLEHHNTRIKRTSTGTRVKQGDLVLVKEADFALHRLC